MSHSSLLPARRGPGFRLTVAAVLAAIAGLGPAVAWDMTTQPPRAEPPSAWPKPSPWRAAGGHMKDSAKALARVYLPPGPEDPQDPSATTATAPATTAVPTAVPVPTVAAVAHPRSLRVMTVE